jgi:hypothetical protein
MFWDVALRSIVETDVSDVLTTSIIKAMAPETSVNFYETTRPTISEEPSSHLPL